MKSIQQFLVVVLIATFASNVAAFCPPQPLPGVSCRNAPSSLCLGKGFFPWQSQTTEEEQPLSTEIISQQETPPEKQPSPFVKLAFSPIGALVVLASIVLVHESGHFLTARAFGLRADEFSVGFGPKLFGFQAFGGDKFSLRLLPLGGYVSLPIDKLETLPVVQQIMILSAGVLFNLILAFSIYLGQITVGPGLPKPVYEQGIIISGVSPDGPAVKLLKPGDVIVGIKGKELKMSSSPSEAEVQRTITKLITTTQAIPDGESLPLSIVRGNKSLEITVTPTRVEESSPPTMGVFLQPNFAGVDLLKTDSVPEAAMLALTTVTTITTATAGGLVTFAKDFFLGKTESSEYRVRGPMGVVERASEVVSTRDVNTILKYAATLSINLGVFNTFPVPPSDGFRIVTTLISEATQSLS